MFQASINGYAPLLLETDWSTERSFESLLEACDKVITNLQHDENLSKKLKDANSWLEWIKAIKDRHGSVEESSMTNVTQINESGVYTVTSLGMNFTKDLKMQVVHFKSPTLIRGSYRQEISIGLSKRHILCFHYSYKSSMYRKRKGTIDI